VRWKKTGRNGVSDGILQWCKARLLKSRVVVETYWTGHPGMGVGPPETNNFIILTWN